MHLTELDQADIDNGFHKALIMLPVCRSLLDTWSDPNELIAVLSETARVRREELLCVLSLATYVS